MKQFNERLTTAKIILRQLQDKPTQWTPLMKKTLEASTPWITQSTLDWLRREGYVDRPKRGLYQITEKGKNLLNAIN